VPDVNENWNVSRHISAKNRNIKFHENIPLVLVLFHAYKEMDGREELNMRSAELRTRTETDYKSATVMISSDLKPAVKPIPETLYVSSVCKTTDSVQYNIDMSPLQVTPQSTAKTPFHHLATFSYLLYKFIFGVGKNTECILFISFVK
jgi:hypothetical protein